jgi:hypothetical protein
MITSGHLFDKINEKIAILRTEITQSGKRGVLNIHKQCENLVKHLLNHTYGYELINLNVPITNFPGLDLGDENIGIAYQVSSDKTSGKVDDTLEKVLRFKHYIKFPQIKIFILGSKQTSYALNIVTTPHFKFSTKKDIVDFDDLLKDIQDLDAPKLKTIFDLLEVELPYTLTQLKGEQTAVELKNEHLISVTDSLLHSQMPYYTHSAIRIKFIGLRFSLATLHQQLNKFYAEVKKNNLYLFNPYYLKGQNAQQMDYYEKLNNGNVVNYFREGALRITPTHITVEFASYSTEQLQLTTLNNEILAIQTLLIFCKQLYGKKIFQLELDIDLTSNGKLSYMRQNSVLNVGNYMSTPVLNPPVLSFSKMIGDTSNETFNEVFNEIIHGFVTEGQPGYFWDPFIYLNEAEQNRSNEFYRNHFAPMLKDLDD